MNKTYNKNKWQLSSTTKNKSETDVASSLHKSLKEQNEEEAKKVVQELDSL